MTDQAEYLKYKAWNLNPEFNQTYSYEMGGNKLTIEASGLFDAVWMAKSSAPIGLVPDYNSFIIK